MKTLAKYNACNHCVIGEKTFKNILIGPGKMTSAQVVETSVKVTPNSPSQDYSHPDDHNLRTYDMTPGFKPFTLYNLIYYPLFFQSWQSSKSLNVDFIPVVHNVTYYNTGNEITFRLNLTHNQSVSADITQNIKVVLSSQYLTPVANSLQAQVGSVSGASYNSSAISFGALALNQPDAVSVTFKGTVTADIHPLANLYFTVLVWGQDSGDNYFYHGPVPSLPTLYAVFPAVSLTRTSYDCKY